MSKSLFNSVQDKVSDEILKVQIIDWVARDTGLEYKDTDFKNDKGFFKKDLNLETPVYVIKMFGKTINGETTCLNALNYPPHFYVKLPSELNEKELKIFREFIESKIPKRLNANKDKETFYYTGDSLRDVKQFKMKDLWGFSNNEKFNFIQLSFYNEMTMKFISYIFKKTVRVYGIFDGKSVKLNLYESNIEPYLRFIHKQNIQPSGWVEVLKSDLSLNTSILPAKKGIKDYLSDWVNIKGIDNTDMAPFLIASFDIECNSSHGDFPLPKKDYEKVAMELNMIYQKNRMKLEHEILEILKQSILSGFDESINTEYKISKIYTKRPFKLDDIEDKLISGLLDEIYVILRGKLLFSGNIRDLMRKDSIVDEIDENIEDMDDIQKFKNIFKQKAEVNNSVTVIINQLTEKLTYFLPEIEGDQVIQIGTTFHKYGDKECCYKHIITLDTCDLIDGVKVLSVDTEIQLIKEWVKLINKYDPDIITGYNIFGFDFDFLYKRADELNIKKPFLKINRIKNHVSEWKVQSLSSAALGDNELKYVKMEGRVLIDMMKIIQRDHKLDSYKLDSVSGTFISGKVQKIDILKDSICCVLDNPNGIQVDSFITLEENEKMRVTKIEDKNVYLECNPSLFSFGFNSKKWGLSKDDVSPKEIFECQKGSSSDRSRVAKYCVMDCALCNYLMIKMETIANNIGMSNVCSVPLSYIFMRGQGIKIFSFVAKQCKEDGFLIPVLDKDWKCECGYKNSSFTEYCKDCNSLKIDDDGYEGAIVLTPTPGIYTEDPVIVLDYSSLYPSSMISENISHDSIVLDSKYDNLPGYEYVDITYDVFEGKGDKKKKVGESTCRFAQFPDKNKGVLPRILQKLLEQRKNTRKRMKEVKIILNTGDIIEGLIISKTEDTVTIKTKEQTELLIDKSLIVSQEDLYNDFEKAVLEGLQLAYKVTANSLYGQVGAKTSPIFLKELAASTTATGRNLIMTAKKFAEDNFGVSVIYGDTDSIFMVKDGISKLYNNDKRKVLLEAISIGNAISDAYQKVVKEPHSLCYEKCLYPFIIFSKKRYVGNLYENDPDKYYRKVMGLSLKRRDFANISKIVYGGVIDIILKTNDINESLKYFHKCIQDILDGKYPLEDFILTKTLKGQYKTPDKIVHKVLADRMASRDKGSAPQTNDRVPFIYIMKKEKRGQKLLQGDKVEDPKYIIENKLQIDYEFYITNQIMNSVIQLYSLVIEKLPKYKLPQDYFIKMENKLRLDIKNDNKKVETKLNILKEKEVKKLLFDPYIDKLYSKKNNMREITDFLILNKN
jgi:DNA polymerase elongation subunit (family B)